MMEGCARYGRSSTSTRIAKSDSVRDFSFIVHSSDLSLDYCDSAKNLVP